MEFRITRHSGFGSPDDALDLLWAHLGARRPEASFAKGSRDIRAEWTVDLPVAMERDEREQVGRATILEIVRTVCAQTPELTADWYAVSSHR
jgi:hypothetical protein